MKVGPKGKERLLENIKVHLDNEKSGVPREGIEMMLLYWVVGLLENLDRPELREELEE